ncbi:hypothetical protein FXO38_15058 [Capsicum annuum]|nr:hypothetical protein FXO38_15058 [Capsicum annuum]
MYKPRASQTTQNFSKNQFDMLEPQSTPGMDLNASTPYISVGLTAGGLTGEKEVLHSCPNPHVSPMCIDDEYDGGVEGIYGCSMGMLERNGWVKHQLPVDARKRDKQHKGQQKFDFVAEQFDEHFPPLPRKEKKLVIDSEDEVDYENHSIEEEGDEEKVCQELIKAFGP